MEKERGELRRHFGLQVRISLMQALFLADLSSVPHNAVKIYFRGIRNLLNSTRVSKKVRILFAFESEIRLQQ